MFGDGRRSLSGGEIPWRRRFTFFVGRGDGGFTFFSDFLLGSLAFSSRYLLTLRVCGLRAGLSSSPGRAEPVIIQYSSRELN